MNTKPLATDWVVYDLETDTVVGTWKEYKHALSFWGDALHSNDEHWVVFPSVEVTAV